MKIVVVSDTHNSTNLLKNKILPKYQGEAQMVVHLGDYAKDLIGLQSCFPCYKMAWVGGAYESCEQEEKILEVAGKKILIMHGHTKGVKEGLQRIASYSQSKGVDACFFGHTHRATIFEINGILFMNPGHLVEPRVVGHNSYGIVTISGEGKVTGEIFSI